MFGIVRNNACIDMRVIGPNIYMYMRGKYTKNPLENYINIKDYYTSNRYKQCISKIFHLLSLFLNRCC
jgi:hypothetical protein